MEPYAEIEPEALKVRLVPWLRAQGIPAVNLRGGIDAWVLAVDPTLRRY